MKITMHDLEEVAFALRFLQAWRARTIRPRWTVGPVSEQVGPVRHRWSQWRPPWSAVMEGDVAQVLTVTQQVRVSCAWVDKKGNPADVENPVFSVSDGAVLSVETDPNGDPLTALVKAVGPVGSGQVNCTVDPKIGPEEGQLVATLDVQVVAGEAVTGTFSTGTPEEQE